MYPGGELRIWSAKGTRSNAMITCPRRWWTLELIVWLIRGQKWRSLRPDLLRTENARLVVTNLTDVTAFFQREITNSEVTMSLTLYHSGLSTCSKQVRHCLREKRLGYASCYVELRRYENVSASYLAINPNVAVPTLVHNGTPITNAFCIMQYIDDVFPEMPLRPANALEHARLVLDRGRDPR